MTHPNHKALRDALADVPNLWPLDAVKEDGSFGSYDLKTSDSYIIATTHGFVRNEMSSLPVAQFFAAASPAAIRSLLDELDAAHQAIATFCADQEWAAESWKAQKHITPLFEIHAKHKDRT